MACKRKCVFGNNDNNNINNNKLFFLFLSGSSRPTRSPTHGLCIHEREGKVGCYRLMGVDGDFVDRKTTALIGKSLSTVTQAE